MTRTVAFFGHNPGDAAVRRRGAAFAAAGAEVLGFMPHRTPFSPPPWDHVDLGQTRDNDYLGRIERIVFGPRDVLRHEAKLRRADLFYARNLDMLALAQRVRRRLRLDAPLVYECLDVHHRLSGTGPSAWMLRGLERRLLKDCALVVVSSPRFVTEHFERHYPGLIRHRLIENRLIDGPALGPRPAARADVPSGPLRIGWFGNLRCRTSLDLLKDLAQRHPQRIEVTLRGYAAQRVIPDLDGEIAMFPNIRFQGRYESPRDLERIYGEVDLVWAADWYEAGANSEWLLPNRLYEGGYFATPALAQKGTETGNWIARNGAGFLFDEPSVGSVADLIGPLLDRRGSVNVCRDALLGLPRETFVEDSETVHALLSDVGGP